VLTRFRSTLRKAKRRLTNLLISYKKELECLRCGTWLTGNILLRLKNIQVVHHCYRSLYDVRCLLEDGEQIAAWNQGMGRDANAAARLEHTEQ
jgi:hypothetical protein